MTVSTEHLELNDKGVAKIIGSRIKVYQLVMEHRVNGWTADDLHEQFPHLSLGAIHAALAYYHDHPEQIEQQIQESSAFAERARREAGESPFAKRMRAEGWIK